LTATSGNGEVGLSWTAPATDGGSAVTGYVVEQSTDGGVTWTTAIANTGSIGTTATVTGLTNGTTYAFRVTAINPAGNGVASSTATATPGTTSTAPTAVTVTAGDQLLNVSWTAPASTGGAAISGYRVQVSTDAGVTWTTAIANTSSAGTTATVGGLTNGVTYQVRVAAITVNGVGADSTPGSGVPRGVPSAPTAVTLTPGNGTIDLAWTAPASNGGSTITGYQVETSTDGVNWTTAIANTGTTATTATLSGLTNGTPVYVRVSAISVAGTGAPSVGAVTTPRTTSDAPTGVSGTPGDTTVSLTWTAPANTGGAAITGYQIERSADSGLTWSTVTASTGTTATTALVSGLTNGTAYSFRVSALTSGGIGAGAVSAAVTPFGQAAAPSALSGTSSNGSASLSWTAPANTGGSAITGYLVQQSTDGGLTWTTAVANTGSTGTTATISGLTNGVNYEFRVAAITSAGAGAASSAAGVTPATVPTAPLSPAVVPGNGSAVVTWTAPSSNGGTPITGYQVEVSTDGGLTWTTAIADTASTATTATVTGLTNGQLTQLRVHAINAAGTGPASTVVSTTPASLAGAPTSVGATAGNGTAAITWTAPANTGGAAITGYRIETSTDGGATWTTAIADTGSIATNANLSSLINGQAYSVRVEALTSAGVGVPSVAATVTPRTTAAAPTALVATGATNSATLSWTAPASDGGAAVTGYTVEYSTDGGATWTVAIANSGSTATTAAVNGLTNGQATTFRVSAINAAGAGATSAPATATPFGPPSAPNSAAATAGDTTVSLTWAAPTFNGGAAITGYRVEQSSDGGLTWTTAIANTANTSTATTISGLTNGVIYSFRISAINAAGVGSASNSATATPAGTASAPPSLATTPGDGFVTLDWTAPAAGGGVAIVGYRVERSADAGATWTVLSANTGTVATSYVATNLLNGTAYTFRVAAVNALGLGAYSAPSTATPSGVPSAPTGLTVTSGNAYVTLNWTAPVLSGGTPITGYLVELSTDGGLTWSTAIANTGSAATTANVTSLTNGQVYAFRVRAINAAGSGAPSNLAGGTPRALAGAPLVLAASLTSGTGGLVEPLPLPSSLMSGFASALSSTVPSGTAMAMSFLTAGQLATAMAVSEPFIGLPELAWEAPVVDGGTELIGYRIELSNNLGLSWTLVTARSEVPPFNLAGFGLGTNYSLPGLFTSVRYVARVTALTLAGVGESALTSFRLINPPTAPTDLMLTPKIGGVEVAWTGSSSSGGSATVDYLVEYSIDGGVTWLTGGTTKETTLSIAGLAGGVGVLVRVTALNGAGSSRALVSSSPVVTLAAPRVPETPPTDPQAPSVPPQRPGSSGPAGRIPGTPLAKTGGSTEGAELGLDLVLAGLVLMVLRRRRRVSVQQCW
jgi:titin